MALAIQSLDSNAALRAELSARGPGQAAKFNAASYAERVRALYARLGVTLDGPG
jgi:hypothetical protein